MIEDKLKEFEKDVAGSSRELLSDYIVHRIKKWLRKALEDIREEGIRGFAKDLKGLKIDEDYFDIDKHAEKFIQASKEGDV